MKFTVPAFGFGTMQEIPMKNKKIRRNGGTVWQRREIWQKLGMRLEDWFVMSDAELQIEVQRTLGSGVFGRPISSMTKDDCLKYLITNHAEQMIGGAK